MFDFGICSVRLCFPRFSIPEPPRVIEPSFLTASTRTWWWEVEMHDGWNWRTGQQTRTWRYPVHAPLELVLQDGEPPQLRELSE